MKILLVYPRDIADAYMAKRPPMGIAYIGTVLAKAGHDVKLVDMRVKKCDEEFLRKTLKMYMPDIVGLTLIALSMEQTKRLIQMIKEETKAVIVGGGPEATLIGKKLIDELSGLDYMIVGEGEYSTLKLVERIQKKSDVSKIDGLIFRKNGKIHINEPKTIEELDKIPSPDWGLFDLKVYRKKVSKINLPIMTSRGCPYSCKFCDSARINKGYRVRSPKNVVDEFEENYRRFGIDNFQVMDDNFPVYRDRVIAICDEMIRRKLPIKWVVGQGFSPSKGDYELFKKMREAGCLVVYFGIESADDEILREIRKPHTVAQARKAIIDAKKAGLIVKAPFLSGLPKSTYEKELEYIQFFKETGIDMPKMGHLIPFPNTPMYDYVKEHGRPIIDVEKIHTNVATSRGTNDSKAFRPAFDTPEYPMWQREKMLKLFKNESEKYILQRNFGKIVGTFFFYISRLKPVRLLGVKLLDIYYDQF